MDYVADNLRIVGVSEDMDTMLFVLEAKGFNFTESSPRVLSEFGTVFHFEDLGGTYQLSLYYFPETEYCQSPMILWYRGCVAIDRAEVLRFVSKHR